MVFGKKDIHADQGSVAAKKITNSEIKTDISLEEHEERLQRRENQIREELAAIREHEKDSEDGCGRGESTDIAGGKESAERSRRQARQLAAMCEALKDEDDVLEMLVNHLSLEGGVLSDEIEVVRAFNQLSDDDATNCILRVFSVICKKRMAAPTSAVGRFVEAWWRRAGVGFPLGEGQLWRLGGV